MLQPALPNSDEVRGLLTRDCMALMREKRIRHLPVVDGLQ